MSIVDYSHTHHYYDILVSNLDSVSVQPKALEYKSNRSGSIISNCADWFFSVIRFSINTTSLPVMIPSIDLQNSSTTTIISSTVGQPTIYSITLSYSINGVVYVGDQTYVQWLPESAASTIPNNTTTFQDNSTNYYSCYSYNYWIFLCNQAFTQAFNSLQAALPEGMSLPVTNPPFFVWNTTEALAVLNCDIGSVSGGYLTTYYNGSVPLISDPNIGITPSSYGQISIFFNSGMYNLFNSFPCFINAFGPTPNVSFPQTFNEDGSVSTTFTQSIPGGNVQILVNSYGGQNVQALPTSPFSSETTNFAQISQEYSTIPAWNPVKALVFASNTIPITATGVGAPYLYNGSQVISESANSNIIQSITDFTSSNADYRGFINYTPSGEYRLIDMMSNTPLTDINISVFWQDKSGTLIPFYLLAGESATMKLMFRKKEFNGI